MEEKVLKKSKNGLAMVTLFILLYAAAIAAIIVGSIMVEQAETKAGWIVLIVAGGVYAAIGWIFFIGLKVLKPQEALVLTLFGKYVGTIKEAGFYFVNPFCVAVNPAASTKLNQSGDVTGDGNKLDLASMAGVAGMAVFNVDNYKEYLSLQCDSALRNIVRMYPYDVAENVDTTGDGIADEGSLRGSSEIVAGRIRDEIQQKVAEAGLEIIEARITYLAYAPEIAAVMLQRQQASAIIDARKMIVDGAVGMVEMALERLNENNVVELDEERKAAMVSNLLVVLCGNHDAQPVVNSGSLY